MPDTQKLERLLWQCGVATNHIIDQQTEREHRKTALLIFSFVNYLSKLDGTYIIVDKFLIRKRKDS